MLIPQLEPRDLYRVDEAQDLVVDACVCDESHHLVFLSSWGRDTAVLQFLARLERGADDDGLTGFHLVHDDEGSCVPIAVANPKLLQKRTTRNFRQTLFGSMIHAWILDRRCLAPDKANASALVLLRKDAGPRMPRLWALIQDTCPLPLLDHWRDTVLELLTTRDMLSPLPFSIGSVEAFRVALDVPALTTELGDLIRAGVLYTEIASAPDRLPTAA